MIQQEIERLLPQVSRPSRYINQEWNSIHKVWSDVKLKVVLAYPDLYDVGLPNLGLQILYELLNKDEEVLAERVYAPWIDMEEKMREKKIPLFSLESKRSLVDFDVIGFTLQHELTYTNILNMLDLAGLPVFAEERDERYPLVVGGGPCAFNPEPLASFFDFFVIGDGEEVVLEVVEKLKQKEWVRRRSLKKDLLTELQMTPGIYVPMFYEVKYHSSGSISGIRPIIKEAPGKVRKRLFSNLDMLDLPEKPLVPFTEVVHDRCSLEIMRGCTRGCRFCQAGIIYRPAREISLEKAKKRAGELIDQTGYEEISLVSLSSSDFSPIFPLVKYLVKREKEKGVSVSLPSLRMDSFSVKLAQKIGEIKKTGLTFAPEAGTQRLRDVINKCLTEKEILETVQNAFMAGWEKIKLYFMVGLPTEAEEDVKSVIKLARKITGVALDEISPAKKRKLNITLSVSAFVPKPHTPFQWAAQNNLLEFEGKIKLLKESRSKFINLKWHNLKSSLLEGALARGDRRLSKVIEKAWRLGSRFDAWSEHFNFDIWLKAFQENNLSIDFYTTRERLENEIFPWGHIDSGIKKEFLWKEYQKALKGEVTLDCRKGICTGCGVCDFKI